MSIAVERIQAICFDVDGTLRDTDDQWVARVSGLLRPLGFMFPGRRTEAAARRAVMLIEDPGNLALYLADRAGLDNLAAAALSRLRARLARRRRLGLPPVPPPGIIPGVDEMLARLQGRFPLAIVSARGEHATRLFLDGNRLTPFFAAIATGQTTRYTKPFPDPLLWAASQLGVPPSACLMVGDTTVDIRAGRAAGAQTVGVLCGFGERSELLRAGADALLLSTADLPALFE
ncbi:MAG: HAD family hydrolase [Chloroflexota bacterium]